MKINKLSKLELENRNFKFINGNYIYDLTEENMQIVLNYESYTFKVIDLDSQEEYTLFKNSNINGFHLKIKTKIENLFALNIDYEKLILKKIKKLLNVDGEIIFEDSLVFKNNKQKWFALFLKIPLHKLTNNKNDEDIIPILNLKNNLEVIDNINIFSAYHMNKKHWISVRLDNGIDDILLNKLIKNSFDLTG